MAIATEVLRANFQGSGIAGPFTLTNIRVTKEADVLVVIRDTTDATDDGKILKLSGPAEYTVLNTSVGLDSGPVLTLLAPFDALNSHFKISLGTKLDLTQPTGFRQLKDWPPASVEEMADRQMRSVEQQQDDMNRALKFGFTIDDAGLDPHPNPDLPVPVENGFIQYVNNAWIWVKALAFGAFITPAITVVDTLIVWQSTDGTQVKNTNVELDPLDNISGVRSLSIDYDAGTLAPTEQEAANLVNVDESLSTGGEVFGFAMIGTAEGSAELHALGAGINVNPVRQSSGSYGDTDSILVLAVNQTVALSAGGAGNVTTFVADDDTITIGDAAQFDEIGFLVDTAAAGGGIDPTFEYSTGVGTWATFIPSDGTRGFRNTGVVSFDASDLTGWVVGAGAEFLIRITRTRNNLTTVPILDLIQIAAATIHSWDKNGDLNINNLIVKGILKQTKGADLASAAELLANIAGNTHDVTGGVAITSIAEVRIGAVKYFRFTGILVLTHSAADLILPTAANITTAVGDEAIFIQYAAGDWRCVNYQRADGAALVGVVGPASSTDHAVARYDLTTGRLLLDSLLFVDDSGLVRVGPVSTAQGNIQRNSTDGSLSIIGGIGGGGELVLWGPSHAAQADDFQLKSAGANKLGFDASTAILKSQVQMFHDFNGELIAGRAFDIHLQDQKTSGTNGGSSSAGVNTRVLNTEVRDVNDECILSGNKFTLDAGTWELFALAPCFRGAGHSVYIYNTTTPGNVLVAAQSAYSASGGDFAVTHSFVGGQFVIAASQDLELRHHITSAKASDGLGVGGAPGHTICYGEVFIRRVA